MKIRKVLFAVMAGASLVATSAFAETVDTIGAVGATSPWTYSISGVVTQPGPTYGDPTSDTGSGSAVNVTPNGAWTADAELDADFGPPGAGNSYWISTESDTLAPSSLISYEYDLSTLSVSAGDTIDYSFTAAADNAIVGVNLVQGSTVVSLYSFDWQSSPPPANYYYGFAGTIDVPAGGGLGSTSGLVTPPDISVQFIVLNEADNDVYTSAPTSPSGLAVVGTVFALPGAVVPLPSSLWSSLALCGMLLVFRAVRTRKLA